MSTPVRVAAFVVALALAFALAWLAGSAFGPRVEPEHAQHDSSPAPVTEVDHVHR